MPDAVNAHQRGVWPHDAELQATLLNAAKYVVIGPTASEIDIARALCCESRVFVSTEWFGHEMMPALDCVSWFEGATPEIAEGAVPNVPEDAALPARISSTATWELRLENTRQYIDDFMHEHGISGLRPVESELQRTQIALSQPYHIPLDELKTLNRALPPIATENQNSNNI
jgi:hypothetical protein